MKLALFFQKEENEAAVICRLCPHHCKIKNSQTGICLSRQNIEGTLYSLGYGKISALNIDPIEKKPLFHFYPGSSIFSLGFFGCSFTCQFCQNYSISRIKPNSAEDISPEKCVEMALESGSNLIAYTYNEPYINYEYLLEMAQAAHEKGLKNVLVTNGYYEAEPWERLSPFIDAMNIDLKGDAAFYKKLCGAEVGPVLKIIASAYQKGIHVEVTNLVITGENDTEEAVYFIIDSIAQISQEIPLHFSRYFPRYQLSHSPTPEKKLMEIYSQAKSKLKYVYLGNIIISSTENTFCPQCNALLIERTAYQTHLLPIFQKGICLKCGFKIAGKFNL